MGIALFWPLYLGGASLCDGITHSENVNVQDFDIFFRLFFVCPSILNLVDDVESLNRPTKNRVFPIKP